MLADIHYCIQLRQLRILSKHSIAIKQGSYKCVESRLTAGPCVCARAMSRVQKASAVLTVNANERVSVSAVRAVAQYTPFRTPSKTSMGSPPGLAGVFIIKGGTSPISRTNRPCVRKRLSPAAPAHHRPTVRSVQITPVTGSIGVQAHQVLRLIALLLKSCGIREEILRPDLL